MFFVNCCVYGGQVNSMASEFAKEKKTAKQEDQESLLQQIEDEIDKQITDAVNESTVDYYLSTRDQVI